MLHFYGIEVDFELSWHLISQQILLIFYTFLLACNFCIFSLQPSSNIVRIVFTQFCFSISKLLIFFDAFSLTCSNSDASSLVIVVSASCTTLGCSGALFFPILCFSGMVVHSVACALSVCDWGRLKGS